MQLPTTEQLRFALQLKLMRRPVSTNRHGYLKCGCQWTPRKCAAAHHINAQRVLRGDSTPVKLRPYKWDDIESPNTLDGTGAQYRATLRSYPWLGKA